MVRRALSVCTHPGCPALTHGGPCDEHRRIADRARGSRQQRGYDAEHERLRKQWAVKVQRGGVHCHAERCRMPARLILAGQPWDLGHTKDRTGWTGPEHAPCNRSTGGANHPSSLQVTKGGGMTPVSAGQEDPG